MDSIEITKNNLNEIKYEDVMFLSFAEPGAMGEPGGIEMLLKNMKVYHVNYCYNEEIKINDLFPIFPPLETFRCGMCRVTNLDDNWQWLDMGMGNYLLVRKEIMEKFLNAIYEEKVLGEEITPGLIYQKWLDAANKILNNNDDTYVFLSIHYEDDEVPHRTYYYISNTYDIKENDRVLVDRNGYETIGTVEKIETFNEKETPFPIEKTKYIIKKVSQNYEIDDWYDDEFEEYEEEIESYNKIFLNNMFNRLSIKRLINLMFIKNEYGISEIKDKLLYMPRMNLFFYKKEENYILAETKRNILSKEIFRILERESIEVPRKVTENIYTENNYKEAILFCRNNYLTVHDDTDVLDFTETKRELYSSKQEEIEKQEFKDIDDVVEYLKKYKKAIYKYPNPDYFIEGDRIIHYSGWLSYDMGIFDLYTFLEKKRYINNKKAFKDFEKHEKEWEDWNIDELDYEKANYYIVRLYNRERICEGLINNYAESGKLLKIIEKLIENKK